MVVGGIVVAEDQLALAARDEVGAEGVALVSDLDVERLGEDGIDIREGDAGLPGDGGRSGLPGLLLLLGGLFPRRERSGVGATVGFVGGSGKVFEADAGHLSMMPLPAVTCALACADSRAAAITVRGGVQVKPPRRSGKLTQAEHPLRGEARAASGAPGPA